MSQEYNLKGKGKAIADVVDVLTSPVFVPIKNIALGFRDVFCWGMWNVMYLNDNENGKFYDYCSDRTWDIAGGYSDYKNYERFYRFTGAAADFVPAFLTGFLFGAGLSAKNAVEPAIKILRSKENQK